MRRRFFTWLGGFVIHNPWKIILTGFLISVISVIFAVTSLSLDADQDNLVSETLPFHKRYKDFLREFGDQEYIYLVVETEGDLPRAKKFIEFASSRISAIPDIKEVTYKIDNPALEKSFLLLFNQEQLRSISNMVQDGIFSIESISSTRNFSELFDFINGQVSKPVSTEDEKELEVGFTYLSGLIDSLNEAISNNKPYESNLEQLFFDGESFDSDGFLVTKNKKFLISLIMPHKNFGTLEVIEKPLKLIRGAVSEAKRAFPNIKVGLTGRPVLAADEMRSSNNDMNLATVLSIIAVAVIFIISFRSFTRPLLAMIALLMGISWTYGFVTLVYGTLNLLSIVFAIVLVGASIEYGIHVVARYQEELSRHRNVDASIIAALLAVGSAVLTSAMTTAVAFATLIFTNFRALQQLGVIASVGIIFCLTSLITVLPAMLVVRDRRRYGGRVVPKERELKPLLNLGFITRFYRHPKPLYMGVCVVTLLLAVFARNVRFDFNLLNMQASGLESVKYERKLIDETDESSWFAISVSEDRENSNRIAGEFTRSPLVKKVDDITKYLPLDQPERMAIIREMAPRFEKIRATLLETSSEEEVPPGPYDLAERLLTFNTLLEGLQGEAFTAGRVDAVEELENFRSRIQSLAKNLVEKPGTTDNLLNFEERFFADLTQKLLLLASGMNPAPLVLEDLPPEIRDRFLSPQGRYAVYVTPKENIWHPKELGEFVSETRKIDPSVTGTPVEVYESSKIMIRAFIISGILAFIMILLLAYLDFRSVIRAFLAAVPLLLGGLWLISIMGFLDIPFNLANFFAIPIIIGIGVDGGIHIIHRLKQERSLESIGRATGTGVLLTAATNAIGFGMMMIASHKGIASLGQIMVIGTLCVAVAAMIVLPPIAKKVLRVSLRGALRQSSGQAPAAKQSQEDECTKY